MSLVLIFNLVLPFYTFPHFIYTSASCEEIAQQM